MAIPQLGLVCVTASDEVRYRTVTRTRYLALGDSQKREKLAEIYAANVAVIDKAVTYCRTHDIGLYRITSDAFPMSDEPLGVEVQKSFSRELAAIGKRATEMGLRLTIHPDQFVVLSSDSPAVIETSIKILAKHARLLDLMKLPRSPWTAMTVHGGKADRADRLVQTIKKLPVAIRSRLTLENDEYAYGAAEILDVCRRAGVPMIFDCHHHAVHEALSNYEDASFASYVAAARQTWPNGEWQLCHLSNGKTAFDDPKHSDFITRVPGAFSAVPWLDVEARGKEEAIRRVKAEWDQCQSVVTAGES